jgi:hypothetical protein
MIANNAYTNFASGELSPSVWGRIDRPFYASGVEVLRNFIPHVTGGVSFRRGFQYVHHTKDNNKAFLITFKFNKSQSYTLEFTDYNMRVHKNGGVVLSASTNITGITQADPGVITSVSHGLSTGDEVYIADVAGMTEVNGQFYTVNVLTADTFEIRDIDTNDIDTSGFTAYSSGGTVSKVYEIATPYAEADLWQLKVAQTADLMYIVHPNYEPRKITRSAHNSWSLSTFERTADPFSKAITGATQANPCVITATGHGYEGGETIDIRAVVGMTELNGNSYKVVYIDANSFSLTNLSDVAIDSTGYTAYTSGGLSFDVDNYPGAVGFYGGRLWYGGSDNDPDVTWGSKGPNATSGQSQYDDFTVGTGALDALIYTITSQNLTVDRMLWFGGTPSFMVIGTTGGLYKANGGTDGSAITPTAISVTPLSSYGAADIGHIFVGNQLVYVQSGGRTLRSFEYDLLSDSFYAYDKNLLAEDITAPGITQIAVSQGRPDLIWGVRSDGVLLSCTFLSKEEVAGWARHYIGGTDAAVLSVASEPQENAFDRAAICVERTINGVTRRHIEYQSVDPLVPDIDDYFTAVANKTTDLLDYRNSTFEIQKTFIRLDSALVLDTTQNTTLTLSALTGTGVTATAGSSVFESDDVGKYIFIKYLTGNEAGVAKITAYTSGTEVTVTITQDFLSLSVASGGWYLMTSTVRGLDHLEGEEIGVITDGGVHPDAEVVDGAIALDYPARYVIVGFKYNGYLRTLDLEMGTANVAGVAQGRTRNMIGLFAKLHNTMGGRYGSTPDGRYDLSIMAYRNSGSDLTDRPPLLFSGMKELTHFDTWEIEKRLHIVQADALPMTILGLIPVMDTGD